MRDHHITYPSYDRMQDRLSDAKASHLILYNSEFKQIDPLNAEWRSLCTPTHDENPYLVWVRWQMPEDRAYVHCTCTAGYYGRGCKHAAAFLDTLNLLHQYTSVRVLDDYEWNQYEHLSILPDWEGPDAQPDEQLTVIRQSAERSANDNTQTQSQRPTGTR